MVRVPVPDDYAGQYISVAGPKDYHYGEADINTEAVAEARGLSVVEDAEGRYVGVPEYLAAEVADYLGHDPDEYGPTDDHESLNQQDGDEDPETLVNAGVCPWCDEYEGEAVPQHASSAHPDEWAAYSEGDG